VAGRREKGGRRGRNGDYCYSSKMPVGHDDGHRLQPVYIDDHTICYNGERATLHRWKEKNYLAQI
jgi:hypothetical protein